ncbi:DNA-3-methyladenine glycosylase I [Leptospira semungkisensis]|uniref:DNA-3-methyladenine glycosylase I n=1 Tax=Leptospira semungkisensis TaxID=2484985 RepID=A0A4R9G6Z5_9LEPT|nr:DNA-3-methyladenine glycosylase I [Leptospira semungkisensis]TGK07233.1 DNA-3-methyladenine glycosylase I [Leptospira semungkisensis]
MQARNKYCVYIESLGPKDSSENKIYHDNEYGFPLNSDDELFGRLILEINQAGLSWTTILKKKDSFRKAYRNFSISKVAKFKEKDFERLMNDAGIIRNKLKINAAIHNANVILSIQKEFGSFQKWIDSHHPKTKDEWVKIFKKTFVFVGGEIVNEFLMSTGYLKGSHDPLCPIHKKVLKAKPAWDRK